jgi:hypothetical protein
MADTLDSQSVDSGYAMSIANGSYARYRTAANGLALGDHPGFEQVELDVAFHVGDGRLTGFPGREVAGFLGFAGAVALGAVTDGEAGGEDLQQERGEGKILLVRGGKPRRCPLRPGVRAGS